jgi:hypothetical protein
MSWGWEIECCWEWDCWQVEEWSASEFSRRSKSKSGFYIWESGGWLRFALVGCNVLGLRYLIYCGGWRCGEWVNFHRWITVSFNTWCWLDLLDCLQFFLWLFTCCLWPKIYTFSSIITQERDYLNLPTYGSDILSCNDFCFLVLLIAIDIIVAVTYNIKRWDQFTLSGIWDHRIVCICLKITTANSRLCALATLWFSGWLPWPEISQ